MSKKRLLSVKPVRDRIQSAYHDSKNYYDDVLTRGSFLSRMYNRIFWSGTDDYEIADRIFSYIPDDFSGKLLDVPVGTAVFTEEKWKSLTRAEITCLDYSGDMLDTARKRLGSCDHISFIQGDVGRLPFITITLINTEEKWLTEIYGSEYEDYLRRVNRCIPWFPERK